MADDPEKAVEQTHARIRAKAKGGPTLTEAVKTMRSRPPTNNEATGFKGKRHDGPVKDEREHFTICPVCGQEIDMRDLGEALHHAMPSHKPLKYPD
ncbi:hypothetical protein [Mesorhizobium sp.]|uniref:hypothetical protein n=1 Tax=Mesorhizobium sp. TaxID=1871066 RepID=UPI0025DE540D|nr:hypothetical protein [Mesorhizobium sp.]